MSDDVLITPASRKIEFKDSSGNIDGKIELNSSGDLNITAPGGGLNIGDTSADVYIGNGSANVDIIFEQSGEIRAASGQTITLGASNSNIAVTAQNFTSGGNKVMTSANIFPSGTTNTGLPTAGALNLANPVENDNHVFHPYLNNDLGHFVERGGSYAWSGLSSNPSLAGTKNMFNANGDFCTINDSNISGSTYTLTLTNLPNTLAYSAYIGVVFGHDTFASGSIIIETSTNGGSSWTTRLNDSTSKVVYACTTDTGGTATNAIRFTFSAAPGSAQTRIQSIAAYDYASAGMENYFLPLRGGTVYGSLNINNAYTFPTSDGSANQVLQTNGSGTLSFAAASGGASNLNGLSDVTISSVQNNDLLKYNSTASRWENTNLGLSVTPTLSLNSGVYYSDQTALTITVTNHNSYDLPSYSVEVRRADNNGLIFNMDNASGSTKAISLETDQVPPDGRQTGVININTYISANNFDTVSTDNFKVLVIAQDFGDLQSEVATLNVSVVARPQVAFTTSTYRYWRITGSTARIYLTNWRAYSAINQGGTEYPGSLASTSTPSSNFSNSWTSDGQTNVASSNHSYSNSYTAIDMFDNSIDSSGYWSLSPTTTSYWNTTPTAYDYEYIELTWDMGTSRQIKSMEFKFNDQFTDTVSSNSNSFIIQGSNNNSNWTTVCTVTDSDQDFSASSGTTTVKVSDTS